MAQILRVSLLGDNPGGEVWSVNPCWEIDGTAGAPVSPGAANAIALAINGITPAAGLTQLQQTNTRIVGVRVEARSLTGTLESQAEAIRTTPVNGTGTTTHPGQCAATFSLRTPGVGPSARGRVYWPASGIALQVTDFRMSAAVVTSALSAFKTYMSAIEAAIKVTLPNANLTVWSRKTANFHDVNSIQLGNVVDTQRRRRDTLIETYQATVYP